MRCERERRSCKGVRIECHWGRDRDAIDEVARGVCGGGRMDGCGWGSGEVDGGFFRFSFHSFSPLS